MAGRRISAISAIVFCALTAIPAAAQVIYSTTQQQPGVPPIPRDPLGPMPGGRQPPPNAADLPPGTATLRGHVYAADNGQPLRKAQVRLTQQLDSQAGQMVMMMPRESRLATTDAQGAYEFKELRAGRYVLTANKGSFVSLSYGQTRPTEPGKPIQVLDNQTIERVDFSLPHGGVITGRILDEFGEPLSDVMVAPQRFQYVQGQRRLTPAGRSAFSNDLGEFRIFGVAPGQYYLQATWRNTNPTGFGGTDDKNSYAPLYFPGTLEIAQAQRLTISVGSEISDVVMTMRPIKAASVTGTIVDSRGQPMVGMLMVGQPDGPGGFFATGAPVRPDGTFQLNGLAPGDYVITAQQMGGNPQEAETATTKITVAGEDISGVQLVAAKPLSTRGRVIVDSGAAASLPPRLALQASSPQQMMPMMGARLPAMVQDDMTFELKTAPGVYRLNLAGAPQGWTIRSVRRGATDVTDSGFEVKSGDDTVLEVELTNKLTTISGLVTNARGETVKDYTAIVFAQDAERWKGNSRHLSTGRPDQDGRFSITGLPPGEYYIIALDRVEIGESSDPEFLEKIHTRASRLSLNEGETKTVDLRVNPSS
jgi:Carboxypeptidase regulatory-like domain